MRHLSALKEATTTASTLTIFNPFRICWEEGGGGGYIEESKERYYSRLSEKLMEPSASPKTYWSVIKSFRNDKKYPVFH